MTAPLTAAELCIQHVLIEEGGFTMDSSDPGNWTGGMRGRGELKGTKYGISAAAFPDLDIRNLTEADAIEIYRHRYWNQILGDNLPPGLALVLLDTAVNCGVRRAILWLQLCLEVLADGEMGPKTLAAVETCMVQAVVGCLSTKRLTFYENAPQWERYGKGWQARVERVEKAGLAMA